MMRPAIWMLSNTRPATNPSAKPMNTSFMIRATKPTGPKGRRPPGGRPAVNVGNTIMTKDAAVATLTRPGTAAPPKNGTIDRNVKSRAKARTSNTRKACELWPTPKVRRMVSSRARNSSITKSDRKGSSGDAGSAPRRYLQYQIKDLGSEHEEPRQYPVGTDHQRKYGDDDFGNEGERMLLDLSECLHQADEQPRGQTGRKRRERQQQDQPECLSGQVYTGISIHDYSPAFHRQE